MGYRRIVLGVCLLSASVVPAGRAQAGRDINISSLVGQNGPKFEQRDVVFIQQYYANAPKFFVDDMLRKEKALPMGASATIVQGKPLPKALVPFLMDAPSSVTRNLTTLSRGLERKVLGARFLLLDSRQVIQDMVQLPTTVAGERRK
ncbi:MAG TPA: hypothetical protein VGK29_15320 [Paludibaculum sp.]|jgi:hypothetical protein